MERKLRTALSIVSGRQIPVRLSKEQWEDLGWDPSSFFDPWIIPRGGIPPEGSIRTPTPDEVRLAAENIIYSLLEKILHSYDY